MIRPFWFSSLFEPLIDPVKMLNASLIVSKLLMAEKGRPMMLLKVEAVETTVLVWLITISLPVEDAHSMSRQCELSYNPSLNFMTM